jgi:hypothetical protein
MKRSGVFKSCTGTRDLARGTRNSGRKRETHVSERLNVLRAVLVAQCAATCGAASNRCRCSKKWTPSDRTPGQLLCSTPNARPNDRPATHNDPTVH